MEEGPRIKKLFADWYGGNPWSFVKMSDILRDVHPVMAASHPIAGANSIWQLVQHCHGWRDNVLRKLRGEEFKSPEDNYMAEPEDTSDKAWEKLLERIRLNELDWEDFLSTCTDETLASGYRPSKNEFTCYEVIHGILHHDNYHFGQIRMLIKAYEQAEQGQR